MSLHMGIFIFWHLFTLPWTKQKAVKNSHNVTQCNTVRNDAAITCLRVMIQCSQVALFKSISDIDRCKEKQHSLAINIVQLYSSMSRHGLSLIYIKSYNDHNLVKIDQNLSKFDNLKEISKLNFPVTQETIFVCHVTS